MFLENKANRNLKRGWIEVVCGSMFSGKTEELLRRIKRATFANQKVELFKPAIDVRYDEEEVVSHDANSMQEHENLADTPCRHSHCFEDADSGSLFQNNDEKGGDEGDDADEDGDAQQHHHVGVEQVGPLEDGGIEFADGFSLEFIADAVVDERAHFVDFVIVTDEDFDAAHVVAVPSVEFLHVAQVGEDKLAVVFRHSRLVQPVEAKAALHRRVLHEIGVHLVANLQLKFPSHRRRHHHTVGDRIGSLNLRIKN